jgi:3',5'-cyclic AMP phosphodiesterase CpdA
MAHTLIQLSDVHAVGSGLLQGTADTMGALHSALAAIEDLGEPVTAIVLSGDIADAGDEASYRIVAKAVTATAERVGAVVVAAAGNHDRRAELRAGLGDESAGSGDEPYDHVTEVDGVRFIALDTSVPGSPEGEVEPTQLDWLAGVLAERAPGGSVLVMHHPPIDTPIAAMRAMGLRNPADLARVLEGSDIRIVLAGHTHCATMGIFAGIPVWVSPAVAYGTDAMAPSGTTRARLGGAYSRIDLREDGVLATAVPITGKTLFDLPTEQVLRYAREH